MYYVKIIPVDRLLNSRSGFGNRVVNKSREQYTGKLVCITCETGFFIARQNGFCFVTGNCHAGAGCTIGTTMRITDKVVPNLVGVDIGCGVMCNAIPKMDIDFPSFDRYIRHQIPSGFSSGAPSKQKIDIDRELVQEMTVYKKLKNPDHIMRSLGTLGGGNHFIEVNFSDDAMWLCIHSGSRNLGKQVAEIHQQIAIETCTHHCDKSLKFLTGKYMQDYLHDMKLCQKWAEKNRLLMMNKLLGFYGMSPTGGFDTVHNFIEDRGSEAPILRKGAVRANDGELLIIPMNMRDGSLICRGKGNKDWNYSAPHGAGRIMSRGQAKRSVSINDFKKTMEGIYTTSVNESTLDESPMVYKSITEIMPLISDTVDILNVIKPVYNFKASE